MSHNKCNDNNVTRQITIQENISGRNGLSAYEIAIKEGKIPFDWTEEQYLDSLKGEQGIPGPIGPQGFTGAKGDTGPRGDGLKADASGTLSARPSTAVLNSTYLVTDTGIMTIYTSSGWVDISTASGTPILNPTGNGVPEEKAVADYVEPLFNLTEEGSNLLNLNLLQDGAYLADNVNPTTVTNAERLPSITIPSEWVGQSITLSGYGGTSAGHATIGIKTASGTVLFVHNATGSSGNIDPITVSITAEMVGAFLRITAGNKVINGVPQDYANKLMLNLGSEALPFDGGGLIVKPSKIFIDKTNNLDRDSALPTVSAVKNGVVLNTDITYQTSKNLFDKDNLNIGYVNTTGVIGTGAQYRYTNPIDVSSLSDNIFGSGIQGSSAQSGFRYVAAYDADMNILPSKSLDGGSNSSISQYIKDSTVKYIIATIYTVNVDTFQIEEGTSRTDYEPYETYISEIKGFNVGKTQSSSSSDKIEVIRFFGDSTSSPEVDGVPVGQSWNEIVKAQLESEGYVVVNNGSPGARAEEINSRIGVNVPTIKLNADLTAGSPTQVTILDINPIRASLVISYRARIISGDVIIDGLFNKSSQAATTYRFTPNLVPSNFVFNADDIFRVYSLEVENNFNSNTLLIAGFGANNIALINSSVQTVDYLKSQISKVTSRVNTAFWGQNDRGTSEMAIISEVENYCDLYIGNKFIPFRRYLASNMALRDALKFDSGFTPTTADTTAVSNGVIPPSFKSSASSAHLSVIGHWLQAQYFLNWLRTYYLF